MTKTEIELRSKVSELTDENLDKEERIKKLETQRNQVVQQWRDEAQSLESQLHQQKFNNKYNLSIDQQVADYIKKLEDTLKSRNNLIQGVYDVCLCERFETYGFDYHEDHPNKKENNGGSRPNTPKVLIETWIGFDWTDGRYPKVLKLDNMVGIKE